MDYLVSWLLISYVLCNAIIQDIRGTIFVSSTSVVSVWSHFFVQLFISTISNLTSCFSSRGSLFPKLKRFGFRNAGTFDKVDQSVWPMDYLVSWLLISYVLCNAIIQDIRGTIFVSSTSVVSVWSHFFVQLFISTISNLTSCFSSRGSLFPKLKRFGFRNAGTVTPRPSETKLVCS